MSWRRRELLAASATAALVGCRTTAQTQEPQSEPAPVARGPDAWIELDRSAIAHNLEQIRGRAGARPVMAVVKCNAYGHGLIEFARELSALGVRHFAVGKLEEALRLRAAGIEGMILNFGPFSDSEAHGIVEAEISQTVWTDRVRALSRAAKSSAKNARVHVNVDTGLGRVGVVHREATELLKVVGGLEGVDLEGVFTGLTEDAEFDKEQLSRLRRVVEASGVKVPLLHAASSAALIDAPDARLDMVRPGIALYGYYPNARSRERRPIDLRPVMSLRALVVHVKTLQPGDSLAYHRAFVAEKPTRVATIPVGYSDGLPSKIVDKSEVLIRGKRFPLVAMITANHCLANLGDDQSVEIGDEVTLLGGPEHARVRGETIAEAAGFSEYKLVIGMSAFLPRYAV